MRLLTSRAHAEEALSRLAAEGYEIAIWLQHDYSEKQAANTFDLLASVVRSIGAPARKISVS